MVTVGIVVSEVGTGVELADVGNVDTVGSVTVGNVTVGNVTVGKVMVGVVVSELSVDDVTSEVEVVVDDVWSPVAPVAAGALRPNLTVVTFGRSTDVVGDVEVVCSGTVEDGKTSVLDPADGCRSLTATTTTNTTSTAIGTTLFTTILFRRCFPCPSAAVTLPECDPHSAANLIVPEPVRRPITHDGAAR